MKHSAIILSAVAILTISCTSNLDLDTLPAMSRNSSASNPYSLANMKAALEELLGTGGGDALQANCLYVRFFPQDSSDLAILEGIDTFDYPLDVETAASSQNSNALELGCLYAAVPANYSFPASVRYEILDECYLPDITPGTRSADGLCGEELELKALEIAGCAIPTKGLIPQRPSGTILMENPNSGKNIPVKGVKVRCNYFLRTATTYTDASGNYTISKLFWQKPSTSVVFTNKNSFTIWNGINVTGGATINCGKLSDGNYTIERSNYGWSWATINNAAFEYISTCLAEGLPTPPSNLKIMVFSGKSDAMSSAPMLRRLPAVKLDSNSQFLNIIANIAMVPVSALALFILKVALPDIFICPGWMSAGRYDELYHHVWHELSHASHYSVAGNSYWMDFASHIITHFNYGCKADVNSGVIDLGESWANAYENYVYSLTHSKRYFAIYGFSCGAEFNIRPLTDLLQKGIVSPSQMVNCMKSDVRSVPALRDVLLTAYPSKSAEMGSVFSAYTL